LSDALERYRSLKDNVKKFGSWEKKLSELEKSKNCRNLKTIDITDYYKEE
jgi:hypothetical protein